MNRILQLHNRGERAVSSSDRPHLGSVQPYIHGPVRRHYVHAQYTGCQVDAITESVQKLRNSET